jgi:hypothetical protein
MSLVTTDGSTSIGGTSFSYLSIGDSWSSGVFDFRSQGESYDGNANTCWRWKYAWPAFMAQDNSWTNDPVDFKFNACSGAKLSALADDNNGNPGRSGPQLQDAATPHLMTMQAGGNNVDFGNIIVNCILVGDINTHPKEYPDPDSSCTKTINLAQNYVTGSFYEDYKEALSSVMNHRAIKDKDVYVYVVGYAKYFNTNAGSEWCSDYSFGLPATSKPKLSLELRSVMNELADSINSVIEKSVQATVQDTVQDTNNGRIKFINPDSVFEGHRFCEMGHNLDAEFFLNDVWFWLWNPPDDDPDYERQMAWIQNGTFANGTQASEDYLDAVVGINSGSAFRMFHPKSFGNSAIKDLLIQTFRNDNIPGVKGPAALPPRPGQQPYASGQARIHVIEFKDCHTDPQVDLSVQVEVWDAAGVILGLQPRTQAGAVNPAQVKSKFEDTLVVTPEHAQGGYVQFAIGGLLFDSINNKVDPNDPNPRPDIFCYVGGWDPTSGPRCVIPPPGGDGPPIYDPTATSILQMDCWLPAVSTCPFNFSFFYANNT